MINDYLKLQSRKLAAIFKELNIDAIGYAKMLEAMSRFYGFRNYATAKVSEFKALELHEWPIGKMAKEFCPEASEKVINAWLADMMYRLSNQGSFNVDLYHDALNKQGMTIPLAWPLNDTEQMQLERIKEALPLRLMSSIGKIPLKRYLAANDYVRINGSGNPDMDSHLFEVLGVAQEGIITSYIVKSVTGFVHNMEPTVIVQSETFNQKGKVNQWSCFSMPEHTLYPVKMH
jgi:hypothetical protein